VSYTINWLTKVISIPSSDLVTVSSRRFRLDMVNFLAEVRRLEWSFVDGFWAEAITEHSNTRPDFAGIDYAPFDEIINGYTIEFDPVTADRVDLLGSNNNIVDVLISNGVTVVPSNSAGNTSQLELLRLAKLIPAAL
jgi:hypothetical protein